MFLHPSNIMFSILLLLSIIIISSSNSWLIIWLCLEINVMMFIPLIFKTPSKYQSEVAVKYFIVQAMASVLILLSISQLFMNPVNSFFLLTALFLKIAAAPLHSWMPALVEGLSWQNFFILITFQKIAPLLILSINFMNMDNFYLFYIFIVSSALIGSVSGLSQSSVRKILTYSSIAHLSWILTALLINKNLWMSYFVVYILISLSIIIVFKNNNNNKLSSIFKNSKSTNKNVMFNFLSLGGLPPFTGFIPKLMVVMKMMSSPQAFLIFPLLLGSFISLFFYLRVSILALFFSFSKPNFFSKNSFKNFNSLMVNILGIILGVLFLTELLDFKLKKL